MYELTICAPTGEVLRRFDLSRLVNTGKKLKIGRAEDCDIRIRHNSVSRHHAEIESLDEDEWVIRDLGSSLGTLVNGARVTETEIESGMTVHLGPAVLKFDSVSARIAADLEKELGDAV